MIDDKLRVSSDDNKVWLRVVRQNGALDDDW